MGIAATDLTAEMIEAGARAIYDDNKWIHSTPVPGRAAPLMTDISWEGIGSVAQDLLRNRFRLGYLAALASAPKQRMGEETPEQRERLMKFAMEYDREDSAQRGEPSPWRNLTLCREDVEFVEERLACARAGLAALTPQNSGGEA